MRSLLVFLHLVVLTHLSEGAPVSVTETVDGVTCNILGVELANPANTLGELRTSGTTPAGLEGVSRGELENLLENCVRSSRVNTAANGDANGGAGAAGGIGAGHGRGGFGSGDGFDDGADGAGQSPAYTGTTYDTASGTTYTRPSNDANTGVAAPSNNPSSASGNVPATALTQPSVKYTGYPSSDSSSPPDSGTASDSGVDSDSGNSVTTGGDDLTPTNSRYASAQGPTGDDSAPYGYPTGDKSPPYGYPTGDGSPPSSGYGDGTKLDPARIESGGRGGGRGADSTSGLGGTAQHTVVAGGNSSCEGAACTNIDAADDEGTVEAAPVVEFTRSTLVPGTDIPTVKEGDHGCSNADVNACVDAGRT